MENIDQEIKKIRKDVDLLKRDVGYLKIEMDREIKHPIASIIITFMLIGVGLLTIYLKDHPELLNF